MRRPGTIHKYRPPYDCSPQDIFTFGYTHNPLSCHRCVAPRGAGGFERLVNINDRHEVLVYTDGSCPGNGQDYARAGAGVAYRRDTIRRGSRSISVYAGLSFAVERYGPQGVLYSPTSNRADLRAVLAALQCLDWQYENVRSIVIATDSTYVIYGCTSWLPWWLDNDWNLYSGRPAKNQDLWGEIVKEMKGITNNGVDIKFWHIPIEWNMANGLAKDGAWKQQARYFRPRFGNANR